jgi:hypothetical protein
MMDFDLGLDQMRDYWQLKEEVAFEEMMNRRVAEAVEGTQKAMEVAMAQESEEERMALKSGLNKCLVENGLE